MEVVIIARNGLADRLVQMVRSAGSHATVHDLWNDEIESRVRNGGPTLIIMEPDLRTFQHRLPKPSARHRVAIAYLTPEGARDLWEGDSPIAFLPSHFDAGDVRTLLETATAILEVPVVSPCQRLFPRGIGREWCSELSQAFAFCWPEPSPIGCLGLRSGLLTPQ